MKDRQHLDLAQRGPEREAGPAPHGEERGEWAPAVPLLGMRIHRVDLEGAVAAILDAAETGRRGYVVTPNTHHVVLFHRDPAFRASCEAAALRLPDGMPLLWASRLLGRTLPSRVAGSDLLPAVCAAAARRSRSVYLCGGRGGVAHRAAARLTERCPGLRVAGALAPPDHFGGDDRAAAEVAEAVNRARPDILFVGLGAPVQETWVHRYWDRLQVPVAICCGAAIDYAAGVRHRAPRWMQRAGLEWLWRLGSEPRRLWRRYLVQNWAFLGICVGEWWRLRVRRTANE